MKVKLIVLYFIIQFLILSNISINSYAHSSDWWDNSWSYRFEIQIPFDTSSKSAKYQPIDTSIEFENECWAKNECEHSIRVIFQNDNNFMELESQIYDLQFKDQEHISSCDIVFLIPEESDGTEKYYIYYDGSEKPSPEYIDHVEIQESSYRYEPISGYPLESKFFQIKDSGYIIYAVAYEGEIIGYKTSQHVTKMKDNVTEVLPKNGDLFAAFDFRYFYGQEMFDYTSTSQVPLSEEIILDGNLMVSCGIVSTSDRKDIKTTTTYKYYFCPTDSKRIHVHVKDVILKEGQVDTCINTDGVFAILQGGGLKSSSIADLNFGKILPYLHVYSEDETISEYRLDPDPEHIPEDLDIRVLSNPDDVDLGDFAWASYDEGTTGVSHSIIFDSTDVIKSGTNERNGIQINAYEVDYPHFLGLEGNQVSLQFGRNSYEKGGEQDRLIPDDLVIEFDAEFFSSSHEGYTIISDEAQIFQKLVKIKPDISDNLSDKENNIEKYNLTVSVFRIPSFPMGSAISALTGLKLPFISAEIYKDDKFVCSGTALRVPMNPIETTNDTSVIRQIISIFRSFDFKNLSFFKKVRFNGIEKGKYVVKICKENPLFRKEKQYVGYAIVDLSKDTKINVFYRPQGSIKITLVDQNQDFIKDSVVQILSDDVVIGSSITDENGEAKINVPVNRLDSYKLVVLYQGIKVYEEPIKIRIGRNLVPLKRSIDIDRYDLKLNLIDKWNLPLEVDPKPTLTTDNNKFQPEITNNKYLFSKILGFNYELNLRYKQFELKQKVNVDSNKNLEILFPAEFDANFRIFDSRGNPLDDGTFYITRGVISESNRFSKSFVNLTIPPAKYNVDVRSDDEIIGKRSIQVFDDRSFDIITNKEPILPLIFLSVVLILGILLFIICFIKKKLVLFGKILIILLLICSLTLPWWQLGGKTDNVSTSTTLYMYPLNLVTITETENAISGDIALLPDDFLFFVGLIPFLIISVMIICFLDILLKKRVLVYALLLLSILLLLGIIGIFSYGTNELAKLGIGGFIGNGNLGVSIPGEDVIHVSSSWGPTYSFYLIIIFN